MFLNLSNHPSSTWSETQLAEATKLGGAIVDLPFPAVDPQWDGDAVAAIAPSIVKQVIQLGATAVMVQGEHSLTLALVFQLESQGIPCYAATSPRDSTQRLTPEGVTHKVIRYEFVRFRRYRW